METKFRIVETEEYTLAVSDGVKAGDKSVLMVEGFTPMILTHFEPVEEGYEGKKIIAYKPKGNAPELDLPLLPYVEYEVEKLAKDLANKKGDDDLELEGYIYASFIEGYKAATKVYSEEDLRKAMHFGKFGEYEGIQKTQEFIQSLKQPKWFVAEIIDTNSYNSEVLTGSYDSGNFQLKTTTINNKTYLEGTYLN
jgi:hypothetical protein